MKQILIYPPVQGENGLFVPITLEEMAKSPEIFGRAGAVCSEVAETPPVVPQELQNAVTEPKVQRLNCANASEIFLSGGKHTQSAKISMAIPKPLLHEGEQCICSLQ